MTGHNDWERLNQEREQTLINDFPYERLKVPGSEALAEWERLKARGAGYPLLIGDDKALVRIAENQHMGKRPVEQIVEAAVGIEHPSSLQTYRIAQLEKVRAVFAELAVERNDAPSLEDDLALDVEVGEWPDHPGDPLGLTVAIDLETGRPLEAVNVVIIPTQQGALAPAFLKLGGWNDYPPAEFVVAALQDWQRRFGAELIGVSGDVLNIRVARRPSDREEAMALAREQFEFCNDLVFQGTETLSRLAAILMESDWWYFWWD